MDFDILTGPSEYQSQYTVLILGLSLHLKLNGLSLTPKFPFIHICTHFIIQLRGHPLTGNLEGGGV